MYSAIRSFVPLAATCLLLAACGDSSESSDRDGKPPSAGYPAEVEENFLKSCSLNAESASNGNLTSERAHELCGEVLACLEPRLTVKDMEETERRMLSGEPNPGARDLKHCYEKVAGQAAGPS